VYEQNPPLPYTGTSACAAPSRSTSATSSRRAFRSHSAWSTAEIAHDAIPGRPAFRTARFISSHARRTSSWTSGASFSRISCAAAGSQYV
jgi:hypothetical protein